MLVDGEEIERLLQDLHELSVLLDGELRRNAAGFRLQRPVDDDLFGRRNVGRDQYRRVALLLAQDLFQILEEEALHTGRHLNHRNQHYWFICDFLKGQKVSKFSLKGQKLSKFWIFKVKNLVLRSKCVEIFVTRSKIVEILDF